MGDQVAVVQPSWTVVGVLSGGTVIGHQKLTPLGDPVVATAFLDRLLHHSHVLTIKGESYRLREKRKAGVLPARDGVLS